MPVLIDAVGGLLIVWFLFTQVIWPGIKGTQLFPMFSKKRAEIERRVTRKREARDLRDLNKQP